MDEGNKKNRVRFPNRVHLRITANDTLMLQHLRDMMPGKSESDIWRMALEEKYRNEINSSVSDNE